MLVGRRRLRVVQSFKEFRVFIHHRSETVLSSMKADPVDVEANPNASFDIL